MNVRDLIGDYNDIKGSHSRSQHLVRELINAIYALLIAVSFIKNYSTLLSFLLAMLPIRLVLYRLSMIRRLHDLGVPKAEVNTMFWVPLFGYRLWWRLLFERGRK